MIQLDTIRSLPGFSPFFILLHSHLGVLRRHGSMLLVLHRKLTLPRCQSSKLHCVTKHLSQRNIGPQAKHVASGLGLCDWTSSFKNTSHDALVYAFVDVDFDVHHGLKNLLIRSYHSLMESEPRSDGKGIGRRVDHVSGSVFKNEAGVNNRITGLRTFGTGLKEGFSDSSDELRRNIGSCEFTNKLVSGFISFRINGLNIPNNASVLACTSWLFFMQVVKCSSFGDCLSVIDSRLSSFALDPELPSDSFNIDLQMKLAHTADDHFFSLFVYIDAKSGIFSLELW